VLDIYDRSFVLFHYDAQILEELTDFVKLLFDMLNSFMTFSDCLTSYLFIIAAIRSEDLQEFKVRLFSK
jgi:hypothetical protein